MQELPPNDGPVTTASPSTPPEVAKRKPGRPRKTPAITAATEPGADPAAVVTAVPARPKKAPKPTKQELKAAADAALTARLKRQEDAVRAYIDPRLVNRGWAQIGLRARIKTERNGEERPTAVAFRAGDGQIRQIILNSADEEMWFARAILPVSYRLATADEAALIEANERWKAPAPVAGTVPAAEAAPTEVPSVATTEEAPTAPAPTEPPTDGATDAPAPTTPTEPPPLPFLAKHILRLKPRETRALLGDEAFAALPKQKEYLLVPAAFDGFRPQLGDQLLVPHGGEGNYVAMAARMMVPPQMQDARCVLRCTTAQLKQLREEAEAAGAEDAVPDASAANAAPESAGAPKAKKKAAKKDRGKAKVDPKDRDQVILAEALADDERQKTFHAMSLDDVHGVRLVMAYQRWQFLQADRKKAAQHQTIADKNDAYRRAGYQSPLIDIDAVAGDASDAHVKALERAEAGAKREMEGVLGEFAIYRNTLSKIPGLGAGLGGHLLAALGDINRFRKDTWEPQAEIDALRATIGANLVQLGYKAEPEGPTLDTAVTEAEEVPLETLPAESPLWHDRLHLRYPEGHKRAGQPQTFRVLQVVAHKLRTALAASEAKAEEGRATLAEAQAEIQAKLKHGEAADARSTEVKPLVDTVNTRTAMEQRADLVDETIRLLKRKHRLENELKLGLAEVRLRKMIKAVQGYMGVRVETRRRNEKGEVVGLLPREQWHFAKRTRGMNGGWKPGGRQAMHLIAVQALKACDPKKGRFDILRWGLSIVLFEYRRRHPQAVQATVNGRPREKYTPGYCLAAARWQFASKFLDWLVRAWTAMLAGQPVPRFFCDDLVETARQKYPEAILNRVVRIKTVGAADLAWQPGMEVPPDPETTGDEDDADPADEVSADDQEALS